jgi:hypothetical protein
MNNPAGPEPLKRVFRVDNRQARLIKDSVTYTAERQEKRPRANHVVGEESCFVRSSN